MPIVDNMSSTAYAAVMSSRLSFSDQVRRAIREAPITRYELSKRTGVDQAVLSRFLKGKVGMSLDSLDLIAAELGWTIEADKVRQRKGR